MKFIPTPLDGAYLVELEKRGDERGFFARFFCEREFAEHGLPSNFVQVNNSLTAEEGALRGLHYQLAPKQEDKLVRCLTGSIWDCIVDLRPESPTFKQWFGHTLSADNRTMMFVPKGFAHAFLTLEPNSEALYLVTEFYAPELERGLRWDDPALGIQWPKEPKVISEKDASWPDFDSEYHLNGTAVIR